MHFDINTEKIDKLEVALEYRLQNKRSCKVLRGSHLHLIIQK